MRTFKSLWSLVNQLVEGYTNLPESEVRARIQEAYEDDMITGTQYDHLVGYLEY